MTTPAAPEPIRTVEARLRAHPVVSVVVLQVAVAVLTVGGAFVLGVLVPTLPGYSVTGPSQSLVLVVVLAVLAVLVVAALRWWPQVGLTPVSQWRDLRFYWLPVVLLAAPLVAGLKVPASSTVAVLLIGYVATAVFEEIVWRGVIVDVLRPLGVWPAVLGSSLLFGLGHLSNSALRGFSVLILLQAFGAAVQGVGLAALRLRTNTIWPLIAIHALHDLSLQLGTLPIAAVEAPISTIICVYGIYLLRGGRGEPAPPSAG
ncbi:MAG: CPBP family intramembrane metalloprotease [Propionibacteriaceae bacterium]|nr:CPBP family intramembrane metalloprotease [Propionibacteriaceae bacterium]